MEDEEDDDHDFRREWQSREGEGGVEEERGSGARVEREEGGRAAEAEVAAREETLGLRRSRTTSTSRG